MIGTSCKSNQTKDKKWNFINLFGKEIIIKLRNENSKVNVDCAKAKKPKSYKIAWK